MDEDRKLTKKEKKELRKLERLNSTTDEKRQNMIKWIILGLGSLIFLAGFIFLIVLTKQSQNKPVVIANDAYTKGDSSAKVLVVEYGDFQCPACKAYYPLVKQLLSDYKGKVKVTFKNFPLTSIHPNAMAAAKAAESAGLQGKFFEMHDILYEKQDEWAGLPASDASDKYVEYATSLKLDIDKFNKDRASSEVEKKISTHQDEGISLGVSGTPTFFVNGKKIDNPQGIEDFKKIVDNELK